MRTDRKSVLSSLIVAAWCSVVVLGSASRAIAAPPGGPSTTAGVAAGVSCALVKEAFDRAEGLRKLKRRSDVPCRLQNKDEVAAYLKATISRKIPESRLQYEGRMYELLGLIPPHYDYVKNIIQLYTEQLGGYYDPTDKYYAMAAWLPAGMQMTIAVHELTHALQDQHYNLDGLMDEANATSDSLLARSALVEGDATVVMIDYSRALIGQPSVAKEESIAPFIAQNVAGAMISAGVTAAPATLQALMIFPYVSGLNFVHQVLRKGGTAELNRVYKNAPTSTAEILHPETFLRGGAKKHEVADPKPPRGLSLAGEKPVFVDTLGEFSISTMLVTGVSPPAASKAAAGWLGDRLALYELTSGLKNEKDGGRARLVLVWRVDWETRQDANEFVSAFQELLRKRCIGNYRAEADPKDPEMRVHELFERGTEPAALDALALCAQSEVGRIELGQLDGRTAVIVRETE